jgi:hypothetical protein
MHAAAGATLNLGRTGSGAHAHAIPWSTVWSATSAIATLVTAVVVVVTARWARAQLQEAKTARRAQVLLGLHDRYHRPELQAFRRRLLTGELQLAVAPLGATDTDLLAGLINELQMFAIYVDRGLLDLEDITALFGGSPQRVWSRIRSYVHAERAVRGDDTYAEKLERLFGGQRPPA